MIIIDVQYGYVYNVMNDHGINENLRIFSQRNGKAVCDFPFPMVFSFK